VSEWFLLNAKRTFLTYIMSRVKCFDDMMWMWMWMWMLHFNSATSLKNSSTSCAKSAYHH
jgi:hypothetical protein